MVVVPGFRGTSRPWTCDEVVRILATLVSEEIQSTSWVQILSRAVRESAGCSHLNCFHFPRHTEI